jgi:transcriptional regulator with XRE-family HTH domain
MTLGEQFKKIRAEIGLSQPELAVLAGIEQSYLSKLENDKSLPSSEVLRKLLQAFGLSLTDLIAPLDKNYIKSNLLAINDIEQLYQQANTKQLNKQRNMLYLASALIVIAVTLFYIGYAKELFNEKQYEYRSAGIVLAGEPINIFTDWSRLIDNEDQKNHRIEMRSKRIIMAQRSDELVKLSREDRGGYFEEDVEGGSRFFEKVDNRWVDTPRAINAWLQVLGVLLFSSGIMGFILERRLYKLAQ